jgi:hypothetical protein
LAQIHGEALKQLAVKTKTHRRDAKHAMGFWRSSRLCG